MKKVTTISIDENILKIAKKEIPNISIFIEDCLKAYLGYNNAEIRTIDENMETIKNCLLNIHYATSNNEIDVKQQYNEVEINKSWLKLWNSKRNHLKLDDDDIKNELKVLGITYKELQEIFDKLDFVSNENLIRCNDWKFVQTL